MLSNYHDTHSIRQNFVTDINKDFDSGTVQFKASPNITIDGTCELSYSKLEMKELNAAYTLGTSFDAQLTFLGASKSYSKTFEMFPNTVILKEGLLTVKFHLQATVQMSLEVTLSNPLVAGVSFQKSISHNLVWKGGSTPSKPTSRVPDQPVKILPFQTAGLPGTYSIKGSLVLILIPIITFEIGLIGKEQVSLEVCLTCSKFESSIAIHIIVEIMFAGILCRRIAEHIRLFEQSKCFATCDASVQLNLSAMLEESLHSNHADSCAGSQLSFDPAAI